MIEELLSSDLNFDKLATVLLGLAQFAAAMGIVAMVIVQIIKGFQVRAAFHMLWTRLWLVPDEDLRAHLVKLATGGAKWAFYSAKADQFGDSILRAARLAFAMAEDDDRRLLERLAGPEFADSEWDAFAAWSPFEGARQPPPSEPGGAPEAEGSGASSEPSGDDASSTPGSGDRDSPPAGGRRVSSMQQDEIQDHRRRLVLAALEARIEGFTRSAKATWQFGMSAASGVITFALIYGVLSKQHAPGSAAVLGGLLGAALAPFYKDLLKALQLLRGDR